MLWGLPVFRKSRHRNHSSLSPKQDRLCEGLVSLNYDPAYDYEVMYDRKLQLVMETLSLNYTDSQIQKFSLDRLPNELLEDITELVATYNLSSTRAWGSNHLLKLRVLGCKYARLGENHFARTRKITLYLPRSLEALEISQHLVENEVLRKAPHTIELLDYEPGYKNLSIDIWRDVADYVKGIMSSDAPEHKWPRWCDDSIVQRAYCKNSGEVDARLLQLEYLTALQQNKTARRFLRSFLHDRRIQSAKSIEAITSKMPNLTRICVRITHFYQFRSHRPLIAASNQRNRIPWAPDPTIRLKPCFGENCEVFKDMLRLLSRSEAPLRHLDIINVPNDFLQGTTTADLATIPILSRLTEVSLHFTAYTYNLSPGERTAPPEPPLQAFRGFCEQLTSVKVMNVESNFMFIPPHGPFLYRLHDTFQVHYPILTSLNLENVSFDSLKEDYMSFYDFLRRHLRTLQKMRLRRVTITRLAGPYYGEVSAKVSRWSPLMKLLRFKHRRYTPWLELQIRQPTFSDWQSFYERYEFEFDISTEMRQIAEKYGRRIPLEDHEEQCWEADMEEELDNGTEEGFGYDCWVEIADYVFDENDEV